MVGRCTGILLIAGVYVLPQEYGRGKELARSVNQQVVHHWGFSLEMAYCMLRRPLVKLATIRYSRSLSTIGASKISEPLRVLFCGSDEFSSTSLRALHAEQQRNPAAIESIDVLYRPGKQSGRGLKNIREGSILLLSKSAILS